MKVPSRPRMRSRTDRQEGDEDDGETYYDIAISE
jgi:hypothetical protein